MAGSTETAKLKAGDPCPGCGPGELQQHRHRFSTDRGPNVPDADWLACDFCSFQTDPE